MPQFTPMRNPTAFRKLAVSIWRKPNDPQLFGHIDVDYTEACAFLKDYNERFRVRVAPTHLVARAIGMIFTKFPEANTKVSGTRLLRRESADVYFNVLASDGRDLAGVRLSSVDKQSLADIERTLRDRTRKIRMNRDEAFRRGRRLFQKLPIPVIRFMLAVINLVSERFGINLGWAGYQQDTFGGAIITSGGMGGLDTGYGALPPVSHASIFVAVMPVRDKPWIVDGEIVVRPILRLCGTFDHRILDGRLSGLIATELKMLLSNPERLLTETERLDLMRVPPAPEVPAFG